MKKLYYLFLIIIASTATLVAQTVDPDHEFADQVNVKWKIKDYSGIETMINARLQENPSNLLGLGIKAYFYVYGSNNLNTARSAINSFNTIVQASTNQSSKDLAVQLKNEIFSIPLSESGVLSASDQDQLHGLFPNEMPMIKQVLSIDDAVNP